ncbi:GreA/GreB family elongation factor [Haloferula chungangensis]|uniref:GreA/GreB family elongation factor n=1 Tax=Haloferula chungangensis TaxID=1048331 RepID=A0ABW2LA44_9BACT
MNHSIVLRTSLANRLKSLIDKPHQNPRIPAAQRQALEELLTSAHVVPDDELSSDRVDLNDEIRLLAPDDSNDSYSFSIVMPHNENIDDDLIAIGKPITLAVLGRSKGSLVSWETPVGHREMTITSVGKPDLAVSAG